MGVGAVSGQEFAQKGKGHICMNGTSPMIA
jgi:hypothetical protein